LFPAQNALALTTLNERLTIVSLYQALGGGWNLADEAWAGETAANEANAGAGQ
jgi:hypothetical protein